MWLAKTHIFGKFCRNEYIRFYNRRKGLSDDLDRLLKAITNDRNIIGNKSKNIDKFSIILLGHLKYKN